MTALSLSAANAAIYKATASAGSGGIDLDLEVLIDSDTDEVTITMVGPADRWFSWGFDTNTMRGYSIITTFSGATPIINEQTLVAIGNPGSPQSSQDLTEVSADVNAGEITLVLTRPRVTGDAEDFDFADYQSGGDIDMVWAYSGSGSQTLVYHQAQARGKNLSMQFRENSVPVRKQSWGLLKLEFQEVPAEEAP
ncbi:MAG: hypothetical protein HKN21_12620 [Candidatus Eisenbacteria bacterium]|uniref:DOMON domain-containing protein n=1 Tax=Eiseniibacteriota bacterium TaxID=2212470 RepID=A0A7Y2H3C7_UNCEI|nr:hypothetical protein [Candidatus Eisenbacteria bacterium]